MFRQILGPSVSRVPRPARRACTAIALLSVMGLQACTVSKSQLAPTPATPKKPGVLGAVFGKIWPHHEGAKKTESTKKPPKAKKTPAALPPVVVGTIAVVNREDRFVLIDATSFSSAAPGDTLTCLSPSKDVSTVRISAERRQPFLIADIVAGQPHVGDRVFSAR